VNESDDYEYPDFEYVVSRNRDLFEGEPLSTPKRGERHELVRPRWIIEALHEAQQETGSGYRRASALLKAFCSRHAFASGNKRTAFLVAYAFLVRNGFYDEHGGNPVVDEPERNTEVLIDTREGIYTLNDIEQWYETGQIRQSPRRQAS
jgi:prophage maintenance system killer protein